MKKIRPKEKLENPINAATLEMLTKMMVVVDTIKKEVQTMQGIAREADYNINVVGSAVDMNFWVLLKLLHEGTLDSDSEYRKDMLLLLERVSELQQEYFAVMSIASFLEAMGRPEEKI